MVSPRTRNLLPTQKVPLVDQNGVVQIPWYKFFNSFLSDANSTADVAADLALAPAAPDYGSILGDLQGARIGPASVNHGDAIHELRRRIEEFALRPNSATVDDIAELYKAIKAIVPTPPTDVALFQLAPTPASVDEVSALRTQLLKAIADAIAGIAPATDTGSLAPSSASVDDVVLLRQLIDAQASAPMPVSIDDVFAVRQLVEALAMAPAAPLDDILALRQFVEAQNFAPVPEPDSRFGRMLSVCAPRLNQVPFGRNNQGDLGFITTGLYGQGIMALDQPANGYLPFSGGAGIVSGLIMSGYAQTWLTRVDASSARSYLGMNQVTYYTLTNTVLVANTPTEIIWTSAGGESLWTSPQVGLISGRLSGSNSAYRDLKMSLLIVVDGPCDLMVDWRATTTAGVVYVPTGAAAALAQFPCITPVKCGQAGRFKIEGPAGFELNSAQAYAQLRLFITSPTGTPNINISLCAVRIEQVA